jgi:tetratricopeptide (TPR) repeat protein
LEIASSLFDPSIRTVVRDISPHKVERELFVNEDGDETAVVLLKATAFSEAYRRLSEVTERNQKEYNKRAAEIKKDFEEQLKETRESGTSGEEIEAQVATLRQQLQADLVDAGRFRSPDYEDMAIACEVMGLSDEALEFYELAASADPENASAGASLARIKSLADKALKCPGKARNIYEEEENKER